MGLLKIVYASSWTSWCNDDHPEIFSISIVNGCFKMPCTALFIYLFIFVCLFIYLFIYLLFYLFIFTRKALPLGKEFGFFLVRCVPSLSSITENCTILTVPREELSALFLPGRLTKLNA